MSKDLPFSVLHVVQATPSAATDTVMSLWPTLGFVDHNCDTEVVKARGDPQNSETWQGVASPRGTSGLTDVH